MAASVQSTTTGSTIQSSGIGSGLDIASIVSQLTTAQGSAQTSQLTARKTDLDAQVSAYGTFRAALEAVQATLAPLKDANKFQGRTATVADTTIATASADGTATPAQYSIQVLSLASAANLVSQPVSDAAVVIGTGTLSIAVGGVSQQITIDASNNTLAGIASAINAAVGNPGINASIINTTSGARLVLTGTKTGAVNAIAVSQSGGDGGLASLVYNPASTTNPLTQVQAATDAQVSVNGFTATSASNQVKGVISGVTINLVKVSALNTPTNLTVGFDQAAALSNVTNFVSAYNALIVSVQKLTSYDADTKVAGTLLGSTTVNALVARLRQLVTQVVPNPTSSVQSLTDLGVTNNLQGTLDLDKAKAGAVLSVSLDSVAKLLGGSGGIGSQLDSVLTQYTQSGGLLDTVNDGLQKGLRDVSAKQQDLQLRLASYSKTLTKQFNAMDSAVAALKRTQSFLTQAFASINGTKTSSG